MDVSNSVAGWIGAIAGGIATLVLVLQLWFLTIRDDPSRWSYYSPYFSRFNRLGIERGQRFLRLLPQVGTSQPVKALNAKTIYEAELLPFDRSNCGRCRIEPEDWFQGQDPCWGLLDAVIGLSNPGNLSKSLWQPHDRSGPSYNAYGNITIRFSKVFISVSPDIALLLAMTLRVEGQSSVNVETQKGIMIPRYLWRGEEYEVNVDCSQGATLFHWQPVKSTRKDQQLYDLLRATSDVVQSNNNANKNAIRLAISVLTIWRENRETLINIGTDEEIIHRPSNSEQQILPWWGFSTEQTRYSYTTEWLNIIGEESCTVPSLWRVVPELQKRATRTESDKLLKKNPYNPDVWGDDEGDHAGFCLMLECVAGIRPDGRPLVVADSLMDQINVFNNDLREISAKVAKEEVPLFLTATKCPFIFRTAFISSEQGGQTEYEKWKKDLDDLAEKDPQGSSLGNAILGQFVNKINPQRIHAREVRKVFRQRFAHPDQTPRLDWRDAVAFSMTQLWIKWAWTSDVHRWRGQLGSEVLIG